MPVTLTITYSAERPGFAPTIETYDDVLRTWVEVSTNFKNNKLLKTVSVDVVHFSFWTSNWKQTNVDYYRQKSRNESENSFSTKLNTSVYVIHSVADVFGVSVFYQPVRIKQTQKTRAKRQALNFLQCILINS